jgi:hypothetical protein
LSGWASTRVLVRSGEPEGGRNPVEFVNLIRSHPQGEFFLSDEFVDAVEEQQRLADPLSIPPDSKTAGVTIPLGGRIVVAIRPDDYGYRAAGHEYVHFQQLTGARPFLPTRYAREVVAYGWGLKAAIEVGDYEWFRDDLYYLQWYLAKLSQGQ